MIHNITLIHISIAIKRDSSWKNLPETQRDLSASMTHLLQIMSLIIYSTEMLRRAPTSAFFTQLQDGWG